MLEPRKKSLLNKLLSGKVPSKITVESRLGGRGRKPAPKPVVPQLFVYPKENGAVVMLRPDPNIAKFKTLAFVTNSGRITYHTPEKEVSGVHKAKIERLAVQASLGKKISS